MSETEKIGNIYKKFIEEFPGEIDKYKTVITKLKDEQIAELEKANQYKDEKLKKTAEVELNKLEQKQRELDDLPQLLLQFINTAGTLEQQLTSVNQFASRLSMQRSFFQRKVSVASKMAYREAVPTGIKSFTKLLQAFAEIGIEELTVTNDGKVEEKPGTK